MAWEKVVLKIDNQDVTGMFNGEELNMPLCDIKDTIKDNIIKVKLAKASQSKGEKSDGESTKG
jgi:hypothetical protein